MFGKLPITQCLGGDQSGEPPEGRKDLGSQESRAKKKRYQTDAQADGKIVCKRRSLPSRVSGSRGQKK
jgi:hypothetical protein